MINRNVVFIQILHVWPPRSSQIVYAFSATHAAKLTAQLQFNLLYLNGLYDYQVNVFEISRSLIETGTERAFLIKMKVL
jgi:hypothetical protein